ncbi:hypothetical protein KEM60_03351 [Austwickia sp. TVS 96-490-7B]|nr:hypothetical protein [Austwickia sp. TVS 96-490-7B]
MDIITRLVIGQNYLHTLSTEFLRSLKEIGKATPNELELHSVLDDYTTNNICL